MRMKCHLTVAALMALSVPAYGQTVLAAGDLGNCTVTTDTAVGNLIRSQSGTFLALGDLAYTDGTKAQFASCYDQPYSGLKPRTRPVPGNHEYKTSGASGYFDYFGAAAHGPRGYYAYDLGDWRVYALNSGCRGTIYACFSATQMRWLQADLASTQQRCKLAYMHHPRWSSGLNGNAAAARAFQALYDGQVSVVLAGHDHHYERFAPMTPSGARSDARGVRQFVVGTGGTNIHPTPHKPRPNSQAIGTKHGVLKLELGATSYSWHFMPISGKSTDSGSSSCVGAA